MILQSDIEKHLLPQSAARGILLADYLQEIVTRQAQLLSETLYTPRTGRDLIDICTKVRGLLTDEEVDVLFHRNPLRVAP